MTPNIPIPIRVNVIITQKNSQPCVEIRRATNDQEIIKKIVSAAWKEQPIVVVPTFTNKLKSINTLIDKGIVYIEKDDGQLYYTF